MNASYTKALQQENIQPAGYPEVAPKVMEEGKDFEFVATVEIFPQVTLGDFSKISVDTPVVEIVDQDIEDTITNLREQSAEFEVAEKAAETGDQVILNYVGKKDGETFEGGSAEGSTLDIGSGRMIPGFEDALIGMKAGDKKIAELSFPDDYHAEELKGAAVEFEMDVIEVKSKTLPELDAAFFEKFGENAKDEASFRELVKENMEKGLAQRTKDEVKRQVMDGLIEEHTVTIPKAILKNEIDALRQQSMQRFGGMQGMEDMDLTSMLPDELFSEEGERRASLGLIVSAITEESKLTVDEARVDELVEEFAAGYEDPEQVREYYQQDEMRRNLRALVMEEMVVETVLEKAKQQDKVMTYQALMNPQPEAAEDA
ncbi:MAG: trigger factor [Pseudomonadota bacterium]